MRENFIALICISILASCDGRHVNKRIDNRPATINDSAIHQLAPKFKEVLADHLASYNKIEKIDKLVIDGGDSLQIHLKYYCLHDSSVKVPKHYLWGGDTTKDFVTHSFAAKVVVMKNKDTVLNKIFTRADFNNVIQDQLKKYSIIFDAGYLGYDRANGEFAFGFSITIPLTDVGVPAFLIADKKGNYKFLDEYAKMDRFKKD